MNAVGIKYIFIQFMPIFSIEQKQICNITITINMPFKILLIDTLVFVKR